MQSIHLSKIFKSICKHDVVELLLPIWGYKLFNEEIRMILNNETIIPLLTIIAIDIFLGGDNAIVVALACRNLPNHLKNKAMLLGISLAIFARAILTVVAVYLLKIPFLMAIGGGLLLYISYQLITEHDGKRNINGKTTLLSAIKTILVADIVMGFDNVIAIAGAAHGNINLVIIGLFISVPIIIWGSKVILYAIQHFPFLIYIGAGVLTFTATKMIIHEPMLTPLFQSRENFALVLQISLIVTISLSGWVMNKFRHA